MDSDDEKWMRRAIALAWMSAGHTRPNPPVGAVVVKNGRLIGEGRHVRCGAAHAEAAALDSCRVSPRGATVYVTLEPCSRPGRVGACTDRLVAEHVARVVYACRDPNPKNAGRAARVLRRAGIAVTSGVCEEAAADLIRPFAKFVRTGLPYVTVKLALTLDGRICDRFGGARWISSSAARRLTGALRDHVDAVMVGAGTVRADDPSLLCHTKRNDDLFRVVVAAHGIPKTARVLTDAAADRTIVATAAAGDRVPLRPLMQALGALGFVHVLCEGGLELARALADEGLVDEWIDVVAPFVLGSKPIASVPRGRLLAAGTAGGDLIARCSCSRG